MRWSQVSLYGLLKRQFSTYSPKSCPRNHFNLLYGRIALIEMCVFVCGQGQDASEIAVLVDIELALTVWREFDPVYQRVCGKNADLFFAMRQIIPGLVFVLPSQGRYGMIVSACSREIDSRFIQSR